MPTKSQNSASHLAFAALLLTVINATPLAASQPSSLDPLIAGYLDGGKAEFNLYDAVIPRYGTPRKATVTHVWVTEPWDSARAIKADPGTPGDFEVLKLNQIISYPTGVYRYEQMWSGFWKRSSSALEKFSLTHHEACGNTFKQARISNGRADYICHSYFEGHGDVTRTVELPPGAIFQDELPVRLRLMLAAGTTSETEFSIFPSVINGKSDSLVSNQSKVSIEKKSRDEVLLTVTRTAGIDRLTFEAVKPFKLLKWEMAEGGSLTLRKSLLLDYWNKNTPADEALLD